MRPGKESLAVNHQDIMDRGRAQAEMRELLTAPLEDGSTELHRRPQCSEVSPQCSEDLRTQGKLLPPHTLLPHPPRHWGFLQPEREVPGYTIEQMKEYGALCAAEALRQNK